MLLTLPFFAILSSTAVALSTGNLRFHNGEDSPTERIDASLNLVLTTINDFYVPVFMFPEDGPYDVDAWSTQTKNYSDAVVTAGNTIKSESPLEKELAAHVVDFVESYVYHDLVAALEEVQTRRFSFYDVGIEPELVWATMTKWQTDTKLFHDAVVQAAAESANEELYQAFEELQDAFNAVFIEYSRELSSRPSQYEGMLKFLASWRWVRVLY